MRLGGPVLGRMRVAVARRVLMVRPVAVERTSEVAVDAALADYPLSSLTPYS